MPSPASSTPDKSASDRAASEAAAAKGRPTPTRKEAEAARKQQLKPALTKKEARERERENRAKNRSAMLAGDEKALLPRDQGPVKRAVRDYVDGRRSAGELFLPGALLILALGFIRNVTVQQASLGLWGLLVAGIAIDSLLMIRGMRAELLKTYEPAQLKGINFYAIMRALQIRRLRVPKSGAKPGDNRRKAASNS